MSERDPPPPGRDNRTIVRPSPRRPGQPATPPPADWTQGARPNPAVPVDWTQGARPASPPPVDWTQGAPAPPLAQGRGPLPLSRSLPQTAGPDEEWIVSSAPAPPPVGAARRPLAGIDELFAPNANPIMRAAAPLLLLLGRLRASLLAVRLASLMDQVDQAIRKFDAEIRQAGVPEDQVNMARYIVCATADDIVQNIPSDDRHEYARFNMQANFFGEGIGGVRFFELIDRAKVDPVVNFDLLELEHACLALGFQGRYRSAGGGFATLQQVQRNIYETLRRVRPKVARDLSPRWKGQALALRGARFRVPVWAMSALAAVLLFCLYLVLRTLLSGGAEAASAATLDLNPATPITIARKVYAPPAPPPPPTPAQLTQLQRIRAALAPEISAGTISVPDPTGPNWIIINVGSLLLFNSGNAVVIDDFKPLADRLRAMLERETGTIGVTGHTDNTPLGAASPYKSNLELSVARAANVVGILKQGFSNPDRFRIQGKGADAPIGDNKTDVGRRRNRRVEITVQRTD